MTANLSSELLRGNTDAIILSVLSLGDSYGYELFKQISIRSGQRLELKETTLYASLRRLEKDQSINSYWGSETQGGRRKYYSITARGRAVLKQSKADWLLAKELIDPFLV